MKYCLYIGDIKQNLYYFSLPGDQRSLLYINLPMVVHQVFDDWITSSNDTDLFLDAINKKYTFYDASINRYIIGNNIHGLRSRSIHIKFKAMLSGFRRRK